MTNGTGLAIAGGVGVAGVLNALVNAEVVPPTAFFVACPVAFALLGARLGRVGGRRGLPLAAIAGGAGTITAFAVQAGIVAVAVSQNPTSHNLWPIEVVGTAVVTGFLSLAGLLGAAVGAVGRQGEPKPPTATTL